MRLSVWEFLVVCTCFLLFSSLLVRGDDQQAPIDENFVGGEPNGNNAEEEDNEESKMTFEIVGDTPGERTDKAGYSAAAKTAAGVAATADESQTSTTGKSKASKGTEDVLSALASRIKDLLESGEDGVTELIDLGELEDFEDPRTPEEIERDERIDQLLIEATEYRFDGDINSAIETFEKAANENSTEATNALGEIYMRGEYGIEQDITRALAFFNESASRGDPSAQHNLALVYSSGIVDVADPALAVLHDYFASVGQSLSAQMSLGYRHMYGYAVPKSCDAAVNYYKEVAQYAISEMDSDLVHTSFDMARLSDETQRASSPSDNDDIIHFFRDNANHGNADAQVQFGRLQMFGARGVDQDVGQAANYFERAAAQGNPAAMAHLGQMYMAGEGVEQNNKTAFEYFKKAAEKGDASARTGLGYMFLMGIGVDKNPIQAKAEFQLAANSGDAQAQYYLANMYYDGTGMKSPDYQRAIEYYTQAGSAGHTPALYNLGRMHLYGKGTMKSCYMALQLFKVVSERGSWATSLQDAHESFRKGDFTHSLMTYAELAEEGFELAQSNAGWLLDNGYGFFGDKRRELAFRYFSLSADQGNADSRRILGDYYYYSWVSKETQESVVTPSKGELIDKLKEGSAYEKSAGATSAGHGQPTAATGGSGGGGGGATSSSKGGKRKKTDFETAKEREAEQGADAKKSEMFDSAPNFKRAAEQYAIASDLRNSQASFSLGYMHQFGVGVPRDLHIAKRYYDLSLQQNADAYLPVGIALVGLRIHNFYQSYSGIKAPALDFREIVSGVFTAQFAENTILVFAVTALCIIIGYRIQTRGGLWQRRAAAAAADAQPQQG